MFLFLPLLFFSLYIFVGTLVLMLCMCSAEKNTKGLDLRILISIIPGLLRDLDHDDHICGLFLNLIANFRIFIVSLFNIVKALKSCLIANRSGILSLCLDLCLCLLLTLGGVPMESEQEHHIRLCYSF
ncbi:hypothetical protein HanXRQr2_Chr03g0132311 [Helianthus annuus]|uniref:Uncharacterized protein n=1 Tax=Helianthus annuus TaxID=4232 RepID=A0A9K3JJ61_HELAN|nr:hypothetical protein HanXRQr2_Chr03g0132311 [Helianthus annuus]